MTTSAADDPPHDRRLHRHLHERLKYSISTLRIIFDKRPGHAVFLTFLLSPANLILPFNPAHCAHQVASVHCRYTQKDAFSKTQGRNRVEKEGGLIYTCY